MDYLVIDTSFNIELKFELAPLIKRIGAYAIDSFIVVAYVIAFLKSTEIFRGHDVAMFIFLVIPVLTYHLYMEILTKGQSIGKKIMKIKVISLSGNDASIEQYFLRFLLRGIDFTMSSYMVGLLFSAISSKGQRFGDYVAGTTVVSTKLPYSIDDTIFKITSKEYKVSFPEVMKLSDNDINTINRVLNNGIKNNNYEYIDNVSEQIKNVLEIETKLENDVFLDTLLNDYNYLSTNRKD